MKNTNRTTHLLLWEMGVPGKKKTLWEKMSFSPLAHETPIRKVSSNIKKTPISGQGTPECLVTTMEKIVGSEHNGDEKDDDVDIVALF